MKECKTYVEQGTKCLMCSSDMMGMRTCTKCGYCMGCSL